MHKKFVSLSVALLLSGTTSRGYAASLAGVTLPDSTQVGGKSLVLNGLGLRSEFMVKVYVAGLYLPQKSRDSGEIIKSEEPKRVVMQFLHDASKQQLVAAFTESFNDNTPAAATDLKSDVGRFLGALEPVKAGDQMVFTYVPTVGTTLTIHGKEQLTIAGSAFSPVLFSVWLGQKPPTASLKKGILGH